MKSAIVPASQNRIEGPLVEYSLEFSRSRKLALPLPGAKEPRGPKLVDGEVVGPTEVLDDDIKWEAGVDEADKIDYIVAVSSGVIAGLVDVLFTGELSLDRAQSWGTDKVRNFVIKVARTEGYTGDDLSGAIRALEKSHPFAADGSTAEFGGGLQHHLRDFSHHFSVVGLFFSIFTQFTGYAVGTDAAGSLLVSTVPEAHRALIGKNFAEKVAFGTIGWAFHMVSDMAGSSAALMGGTGIPGPLLSLMKELSALPFFASAQNTDEGFRLWVSKLFNGTQLADRDESGRIIPGTLRKFDLRTEIGLISELGRQAAPVLLNQALVRGFYFFRRLARELKSLEIRDLRDLKRIDPESVLPWGTPAMRRMITVSSGVFTGVDLADAFVRSALSGMPTTFFLRVNYVGVATFVIACAVDLRATIGDKTDAVEEEFEEVVVDELAELASPRFGDAPAIVPFLLERAIVDYDIATEKDEVKAGKKREWRDKWIVPCAKSEDLVCLAGRDVYVDDDGLYNAISTWLDAGGDESWLWLAALRAKLFAPYFELDEEDKKAGRFKGLKLSSDYLGDVFCKRQEIVSKSELTEAFKTYGRERNKISGSTVRAVKTAAVIGAITTVSAGTAFAFAPAIAPALAGALGLKATFGGAALTNASLAFLGGGSLAAGGAGMAGGTMLITGGGALLGALGSSSLAVIPTSMFETDPAHVLNDYAVAVSICKDVLIGRYGNLEAVKGVHDAFSWQIVQIQAMIEAGEREMKNRGKDRPENGEKTTDKNQQKVSPEKTVKNLRLSLDYIRRSRNELTKVLRAAQKGAEEHLELHSLNPE